MNHHRLIAGITAAFVIILAAILIFHQQLGIPIGPSAPGTEEAGPTVEGPIQTSTGQIPEAIAPEFAFRRLEIDTTKAQAEACLVFTRNLDASRPHPLRRLSLDRSGNPDRGARQLNGDYASPVSPSTRPTRSR